MRVSRPVIVAAAMLAVACSDAGTRVAYDIEAGVKELGAPDGARVSVRHVPKSWPGGCSGAYTLTIERGTSTKDGQGNFRISPESGGLAVRCANAKGGGHDLPPAVR
jgi:hypothetical protein